MGKILKHSIVENVPFWVLAGISIIMGIISFYMPPKGDIKPSVIEFIGWMFAFAALWTVFVAMVRGIDARITHGKTSLSMGNFDEPKNGSPIEPQENEEVINE